MFRSRIVINSRIEIVIYHIKSLSYVRLLGREDGDLSAVTCGQGNEFRTRDVASPAESGGLECEGKKYSIGGKVR